MDKLPLKSKKFLAYIMAEFTWKVLIFYVIYEYSTKIEHYAFLVLLSMIITSGFIQIGYILGQAALDKYTHIATTAIDKDPTPSKPKEDKSDTGQA